MRSTMFLAAAAAAVLIATTPALAVTNIIKNGSFEAAGATGPNAFTGWTKSGTVNDAYPGIVINYNSTANYAGGGAFGERVTPDNIANSASPDAVGSRAAYFVSDRAFNEAYTQTNWLSPGNYRIGFSFYLTQNGKNNPNNASLQTTILGTQVAVTNITAASTARTWFYATGVARIQNAGFYPTSLVFNSNGFPSKDVVVDRVFGVRTLDPATVVVPETTVFSVPEPSSWAMMLAGFGLVGLGMRRRPPTALVV